MVRPPQQLDSRPPRWYSHEELAAIYAESDTRVPWWRFFGNTGLRRSEALALIWDRVLADRVRIISSRESRTRSRRWRDVPLSPGAQGSLETLRRSAVSERVLPGLRPHNLTRAFRLDAARAGPGGRLHDLRHTFCSHLVMGGVPLRTVQVLAGHASITPTGRYARLAPESPARSGHGA